jgi:hypothetical protein
MLMETITDRRDPYISHPGVQGHGEALKYKGRWYYYRGESLIPKNCVSQLKWEGNWAGRQVGEKDWIIVCWDGSTWICLDHTSFDIKDRMKKYKGKSPIEAIQMIKDEEQKETERLAALPKCKECKKPIQFRMYDNQPRNICCNCFKQSIKG